MAKVGTISPELIERIKAENNIKEVAEELGLKINSHSKARCPFHKEGRTPNLHFHEETKSYHCYTCNAGTRWQDKDKKVPHVLNLPDGTKLEDGGPSVIGLVMNLERCGYVDACVYLMERAGIPIPEARVDHKAEREKKRLTALNKEYCKALLQDKAMLAYLSKRGIVTDSIKKWRLGVVPDAKNYMFGKRVQGRLVFGLVEVAWNPKKAKTIAMAYRAMTEEHDNDAKYINDAKSDLYVKKQYLYGLNEAKKAIREAGYAIMMEGYVDVIISHQSGIENAVACCGTAFTDEQMDILKKITDQLVFWFDGDPKGWENMISRVTQLINKGFRVLIIDSSPLDPAELMNKLGQDREKILQYIGTHAKPAMQVMMEATISEYHETISLLESQINKKKLEALDELLPLLNTIHDESEKVVFKSMISQKLGVSV